MDLSKPNVLLITTDQHRADSMGCYGHPCVQTPHLDQLACEGFRFENAYTDCPVCVPARTTIITGIDSHTYGMPSYCEEYRINRDKSLFLGSLMTKSGYQTQVIGKTHWHLNTHSRGGFESVINLNQWRRDQLLKTGKGFDPTGIGGNELTPALSQMPPELCHTDWMVNKCLDFLEYRDKDNPFFLWLSLMDPHPPFAIHEPFYSMYDNDEIPDPVYGDWCEDDVSPRYHYIFRHVAPRPDDMSKRQLRKARSVYYGTITNIDYQLGRLFGKLQRDREWENTIIIYTTDHGEFLGDHHAARKSSFCECTARIPFIIRDPRNQDKGRVSDALVNLSDLLPTICDYAGTEISSDITGKSLKAIVDKKVDKVRPFMHGQIDDAHMYHDGRYKYLFFADDGSELLFDVTEGRNDLNSIKDYRVAEMRQKLIQHLNDEKNNHVGSDGMLLNKGLEKPPLNVLKSWDAMGLASTAAYNRLIEIG